MLKKILVTSLSLVLILSLGMLGKTPKISPPDTSVYAADWEQPIVRSYYLSSSAVKDLAANMKMVSGRWSIISSSVAAYILTSLRVLHPLFATGAFLAAALGAYSQSSNEVMYASNHGFRVKVTITDNYPHTSYSTVVRFRAVVE